jgi:hypothetical protein
MSSQIELWRALSLPNELLQMHRIVKFFND